MRKFRVVTHRNWLGELFAPYAAVQDFGMDIDPETALDTYWWAPGAWVASAAAAGVDLPLLSCGPYWLDSLPKRYVGRTVRTLPLAALTDDSRRPLFVKLPEAKVESCPARVYDTPRLAQAWRQFGFSDKTLVQLQSVVNFTTEARFFVADGVVTASSVYRHGEWVWGADDIPTLDVEMRLMNSFVRSLLSDRQVTYPPGFVLDVGISAGGKVRVVEANAAWSSNPYEADPGGVVTAIKASHDFHDLHRKWRWRDQGIPQRPLKIAKTPVVH